MKKIVLSIVLATIPMLMAAQENHSEKEFVKEKFFLHELVSTSSRQHNMKPVQNDLILGWQITNKLSVFADYQAMLGLYNADGTRNYYRSRSGLGGGFGYEIANIRKAIGIDVRALATTTVGSPDWKYTQYDIGFIFYDYRNHQRFLSPVIGIGYRFTDSRTAGLRNLSNIYFQMGFDI